MKYGKSAFYVVAGVAAMGAMCLAMLLAVLLGSPALRLWDCVQGKRRAETSERSPRHGKGRQPSHL